jgi:hypothetical protein
VRGLWAAGAVVVVTAAVFLLLAPGSAPERPQATRRPAEIRAVDRVAVGSFADLVAASACVVDGRVTAVARGPAIGSSDAAVISKLVELEPVRVLSGTCPDRIVVEEEGWLLGGRPVRVNGWPGSEPGDRGVWFLSAPVDDDGDRVTVATSGAIRFRDGRPLVPASAPAWLRAVAAEGLASVVAAVG